MGKYFTISELCESAKADELGIVNIPNEEETQHLEELIEVIDRVREGWTELCEKNGWGRASIRTNSGFRCEALNKAVGGSKTSAHRIGYAIDFEPNNQKNKEFYDFMINWLRDNKQPFDQLINEKPRNGVPSWIHFGLKNRKGEQRGQIFTLV